MIEQPRLVVEFSGLPATGKSSTTRSLCDLLRRDGHKVSIIRESADVCPLRDLRGQWQFNAAGLLTTLHRLLIVLNEEPVPGVLLFDRGIYDALCWFDWLRCGNGISDREHAAFSNFLTQVPWLLAPTMVFQFSAEYATCLARRGGREGFITNAATHRALAEVYGSSAREAPRRFPSFDLTLIDTTNVNADRVLTRIHNAVTSKLDALSRTNNAAFNSKVG